MNQNVSLDATLFQDVTRSVDQLCNQMSLANIKIPRYDACSDVFDFITEFDTVTTALSDDQKVMLLNKSFPPGCYRSWFESELKPMIDKKRSWREVKNKIINRFSSTEDRDRHFTRLRELKFDLDGRQCLLDFVEDIIFSYKKAFPVDDGSDSCIRYVKAALPQSLRSILSADPDFRNATNEDMLKKSAKQYDLTRSDRASSKVNDRLATQELASLLKEMMIGIRKDNELTRNSVVAALQQTREYRSDSKNVRYERGQSPSHSNYRPRAMSPSYAGRRTPSPRRYSTDNQDRRYVQTSDTSAGKDYQLKESQNLEENVEAFDSKIYYARFGKPSSPCSRCNCWHWSRHCLDHLN